MFTVLGNDGSLSNHDIQDNKTLYLDSVFGVPVCFDKNKAWNAIQNENSNKKMMDDQQHQQQHVSYPVNNMRDYNYQNNDSQWHQKKQ